MEDCRECAMMTGTLQARALSILAAAPVLEEVVAAHASTVRALAKHVLVKFVLHTKEEKLRRRVSHSTGLHSE